MTELAAAQAKVASLLAGADEVCLACHVRPDADALGSMLALAHALRAPGRRPQRVTASFGDQPFEVPEILRFLPGLDLLSPPQAYPDRPELMVTFDAGSIDRLGLLAGPAARAGELVVIDHHASNTRFGTIHLVDPAAAATAILVLDLIDTHGHRADHGRRARPVRRAGHRHRLVQVPRDHPGRAPGGGAAAGHRDRTGRGSPAAVGPGPVQLPGPAVRRAGPGRPGAGRGGRARPGVDHGQLRGPGRRTG